MLKLINVKKEYIMGDMKVDALNGISVEFRKSEFVSILGPSGCGKTTTLNIIGGLDRYTSGDLIISDISTKNFKDSDWDDYRNKKIGFVFQSYNLISHLSILANVEISLTIAGIKKSEQRKRAIEALQSVGLGNIIKKRPNQLSGGQMQRVAIARALVNNPEIILADEPTGALDSETSVQIMELLKEISKEKLIIMVTHNESLAEKYSSRIIKIIDGQIISDSNPYSEELNNQPIPDSNSYSEELNEFISESKSNSEESLKLKKNKFSKKKEVFLNDKKIEKQEINDNNVKQSETNQTKEKNKCKMKKQKKSKMSFFTALSLSFKNLFAKKGRTILTSFAGSIGIIGIALVLAISNGFTAYINRLQSDTLSGYPVSISNIAINYENISSNNNILGSFEKFPDTDEIFIFDPKLNFARMGHYNLLTEEFLEYITDYKNKDNGKNSNEKLFNEIKFSYSSALPILTKKGSKTIKVETELKTSSFYGSTSSPFYEGLENSEFVVSQYEVLSGTYPKNKNEIALVIDSKNRLSKETLDALGVDYDSLAETLPTLKFSDFIEKEYKLILNDDYYKYNESDDTFETPQESDFEKLYDKENNETLKITAVLRIKEESTTEILTSGIMYLPELTEFYTENCKSSEVATRQKQNNQKFYIPYKLSISELGLVYTLNTPVQLKTTLKNSLNQTVTDEQAVEIGLQMIGASKIPTAIYFYPKSFDAKDNLATYIDTWNATEEGKESKILITDATQLLTASLGQLVNIISYVLIAFAGISLVVSSIMIGIITYVSVIERTKEIGILRSIGARKKDITRMFNAETFMIGFSAGILGGLISFLLTIPINLIIGSLATGIGTIATLKISQLTTLTLISIFLSLISGIIPSFIAAKKDPVVALRTE